LGKTIPSANQFETKCILRLILDVSCFLEILRSESISRQMNLCTLPNWNTAMENTANKTS